MLLYFHAAAIYFRRRRFDLLGLLAMLALPMRISAKLFAISLRRISLAIAPRHFCWPPGDSGGCRSSHKMAAKERPISRRQFAGADKIRLGR